MRKFLSALMIIAALLTLPACGGGETLGYRQIVSKETEEHRFAFRSGDPSEKLFMAALSELMSENVVPELAARWLSGAAVSIKPDKTAIAAAAAALQLESIPERDFILGIDETAEPFSFTQDGVYAGFDIELAGAACQKLGWKLKIQPVTSFDVGVELLGGNIDCAGGSLGISAATSKISVSESYLTAKFVFFVKADSRIKKLSQLSGKYVTMRDDIETINALLEGVSFSGMAFDKEYLPTIDDCLSALGGGKCDAVLLCEYAAKYKAR